MTPRFELLPMEALRPHEQIDEAEARRLTGRLRAVGQVEEPLLVADGSWVILNGHHRYAALRALGARFALPRAAGAFASLLAVAPASAAGVAVRGAGFFASNS